MVNSSQLGGQSFLLCEIVLRRVKRMIRHRRSSHLWQQPTLFPLDPHNAAFRLCRD